MSLFRSASGPGGLSINTGAANSLGTPTSQPGGLFGASTTQATQPATTGGLFGTPAAQTQQTATSQPQQAGGLFGSVGGSQQQQRSGGGLFGSSTATSQPQQTGGLFGSTAPAQQQQTGGLFGSATTTAQPQQTGGLFGSSTQQPQQQQTGGLFGSTQQKPAGSPFGGLGQSQQQQQPASTGLFGNTQNQQSQGGFLGQQPTQTGTGGLFGQSQAQPRAGGLFGSSMAAPIQSNAAPGLTMGQSTTQQTMPGVRVDVSNVKGTTRFNDLEDSLQKELEACDTMIQHFIGQSKEIHAFLGGHGGDLEQLSKDVAWLQRKYDGVKTTLDEDIVAVTHLKKLIKEDADVAKMGFRGADQLKLPGHYHQSFLSRGNPSGPGANNDQDGDLEDVLTLFSKEADRLAEMHRFQAEKIKEMEQHMPGVEHGLYERVRTLRDQSQMPQFNMILEMIDTIKMMGDKIYEAAASIVTVREELSKLQRQYPSN